jgi:putative phosphoribosyl transferase
VQFRDRSDAGRRLAQRLEEFRGQDLVVLGLPRGGVPVAAEVARALALPLDVVVVRKVGAPFHPELAMGAVGEGGIFVVDERVVARSGVLPEDLAEAAHRERLELDSRVERFRGGRPAVALAGRGAVVVDDGVATGSTARAACAVVRALGATRLVLATPVCSPEGARRLTAGVDQLICLQTPRHFAAVGQFYADFRPTRDAEVLELLGRAARTHPTSSGPGPPAS